MPERLAGRGLRRAVAASRALTREAEHARAQNRAFEQEILGERPLGIDPTSLAALPSLSLLRHLAARAFLGVGTTGLRLRSGGMHWASRRTRLRPLLLPVAWELVAAGQVHAAERLADLLHDQDIRPAAMSRVRAALAVRQGDWAAALSWQRKVQAAFPDEPGVDAEAWVAYQARLRSLHTLATLLAEAETPAAKPMHAKPELYGGLEQHGAAEQHWAQATRESGVPPTGPESVQSVLAAIGAGRDPSHATRYAGAFLGARIARGEDLSRLRPLFQEYAAMVRPNRVALASPEAALSIRTMSVETFRTYLAGKSVCLVANSPLLLGSGLGEAIDGYDLVMRFNSFLIEPADTGRRTDIHVTVHAYDYNWDVTVPVRIVLGSKPDRWRESLKARLRPGAQRWLGDSSLAWPTRDLELIRSGEPVSMPSSGFHMLRLLMRLDVSTAIDLIGFDFLASGQLRVAGAMHIPASPAQDPASERDWVLANAVRETPMIISMREDPLPR